MEHKYYDGTKILSMSDMYGREPEVYVVEGNRVGGKTTFFYKWRIKKFLKSGEKTLWLYRFQSDIDDCANKIFKDLKQIKYQSYEMTYKTKAKGRYAELYLNEEHCGYALPINSSDAIKNMSHVFVDVDWILFDEFQPESGKYCPGEMKKFHSIHTSISRGGGKQVRRVPVVLIGNTVSLLNPYFVSLGLSKKLQPRTKFMRGNGWVYEKAIVDSAKQAQKESAFNNAFGSGSYNKFSQEGFYINDNNQGIKKLKGDSRYLATIYYGSTIMSLKLSLNENNIYMCTGGDSSYPIRISLTPNNMVENTMLKSLYKQNIGVWRYYFELGRMRFEGAEERECAFELLSL